MDLKGFDDLIDQFDWMLDNVEDDVNTVVKNNAMEMTEKTLSFQVARFTQGYWTGNMARSTMTNQLGSMNWQTHIGANYAGFMEFGTRYYSGGTLFLFDAYRIQRDQLNADLKRLIEG